MARVHFTVNGTTCSVGGEVSSDWTLLEYLRETLNLRGTKYMCREAGCGACIVTAQRDGESPISVNTCMVSVTSCENWNITTIEEIGNRQKGYHVVQKTLAEGNGSQCGYCSPGWVMAMYSLLKKNKDMSMLEIEKSFGSNICRCTGYRPIIEAFKKFAVDSPDPIKDIEDLNICKKTGKFCKKSCEEEEENDWCFIKNEDVKQLSFKMIPLLDGKIWFKVFTVEEIFQVLEKKGDDSYMLVNGNTAKGAYPIEEYPRVLIDISSVAELKCCFIDQNLVVGAGTTLAETINIFDRTSSNENFAYLSKLSYHIGLVAHIPVRNIASLAGNLMIKHEHNFFQSDIFLLFETVGAQLTIQDLKRTKQVITMQQFLKTDMRGKVILNILFPPLNTNHKVITFKVMPRAQSAHAIVNSGFLYKLNDRNIVESATIVFGGISPVFNHAASTEKFLVGKPLFTNETLQGAIISLKSELLAVDNAPDPSPEYREKLALGLFYKGLLSLCPQDVVSPRYRSATEQIRESRPVSSANQIIYTHPELWPLTQPMPKLEALVQCAGEAQYIDDLPPFPHQVFAALVLSTVPKGEIVVIDPSVALAYPGVKAFFTAKDIPGLNTFSAKGESSTPQDEEVFAGNKVSFFNQPIGVIIAENRSIADRAAKLIKVSYQNIEIPVLDIREAKNIPDKNILFYTHEASIKGTDVAKIIKGSSTVFGQYAFVMETIVNITKPVEDELDIFTTTQWMEGIQITCSRLLSIPQNKINIYIRRLGGGYGYKVSRNMQTAQACHLAATKLNRPVRAIQSLTTNMKATGKRYSSSSDYEVQVNNLGIIQYVDLKIFEDNGYMSNEQLSQLCADVFNNVYDINKWDFKLYDTMTDKAKNSWVRSPGTLEGIAMAENILERISYELCLDPIAVRLANLEVTYRSDIEEMVDEVKTRGMYSERKTIVNKFNLENRWKKRGLRLSLMRWTPTINVQLEVNMSVNHSDGTVAITHGGIEMGQGINTKAIQICAHFLGISIDKVRVKPNNNVIAPNSFSTAGSLTSQSMGIGVQRCCEQLLERLEPIRKLLDNPTWEQLILRAFQENVDLQCHGFSSYADVVNYNIYGVCLSEVEIDVLTGELQVVRVDLLEDVGQSVSPQIDLGQVEGAFIMGLGYWTSEHLVYDNTGECLTDRTWNYYVPQARDIPLDFKVYFRNKSYSAPKALGSKCTGEPPLCLAVSVPFAIREAITSARQDSGLPYNQWYDIDGPFTAEAICLATATHTEDFKFY